MEKKIKKAKLSDLIPYENNPRINDDAVDAVKKSIEQCGYIAPIIVDENMIVLAGHTRLKAMQELGNKTCEIMQVFGMDEDQKKKYRLLDNKTNELSLWDYEILESELSELDFGDLELDWDISDIDYMDSLMEEGIEGSERTKSDCFSVTFTLSNEYKDDYDDYIDENGKKLLETSLIKEIKRGVKND